MDEVEDEVATEDVVRLFSCYILVEPNLNCGLGGFGGGDRGRGGGRGGAGGFRG